MKCKMAAYWQLFTFTKPMFGKLDHRPTIKQNVIFKGRMCLENIELADKWQTIGHYLPR